MSDKENKIYSFLELFKELELKLVSICNIDDEYVSYSRALNTIHFKHLDPTIDDDKNYTVLKQAGDLRNILSHNNDILIPSDNFLFKFNKIASKILSNKTAYDISNKKIIYVKQNYLVKSILDIFENNKLTHLPIVNDDLICKGVFSRSTFFDYIYLHKTEEIDIKNMYVSSFYEVTKLDSHLNEEFVFVSRYDQIRDLYQRIVNKQSFKKNIGLFIVTEHGSSDEKIIGLITMADFNLNYKR